MRSSLVRRLFTAAALTMAAAVAACVPDSPTAPRLLQDELSAAVAPAPQATVYRSKDDPRLLAWLEREKRRVDAAQKASQATYDSLQVVWERLKKLNPNGNPAYVYCQPISYVAEAKIVGPKGEDIGLGPHKLRIPQGALAGYTVITAVAPVSMWSKPSSRHMGSSSGSSRSLS